LWGFFYICQMLKNFLVILLFPFLVNGQSAFISGNDTICDNDYIPAEVIVSFTSGTPPYTFIYQIDGINQLQLTTFDNPFTLYTKTTGVYTLQSFSDDLNVGTIDGSAVITVLQSPTAMIHLESDTLSTIFPVANFFSQSIGNIVSWDWNFGDYTSNINTEYVSHMYSDSSAFYEAVLIVQDINGCVDTSTKIVFVINNEQDESYSMWIPNSFTPNNEEPNNEFCIEFNSIQEETFIFKVYNSQGDLMYQSTTPNALRCCVNPPDCSKKGGWNGKHYLTNKDLPSDAYVYEMYYKEEKGWKHKEIGTITLVR